MSRSMFTVILSLPLFVIMMVIAMTSAALAQASGGGGGQPSALMSVIPFVVMFGIMYFLMIRPQIKKQKLHQDFLGKLKRGDEVLTSGGLLGRIEGLTDLYITLEIAPGVRIKILRSQIASFVPNASAAGNEVKA